MITNSKDIGIIADDLTGACDVAGSFAKFTGSVCVHTSSNYFREIEQVIQVTNLSTRTMAPEACKNKMRVFAAGLKNCSVIFMKIDAALRGSIGAQIEGLLTGIGPRRIVVAPALPQIGRTTRGGIQYASGVPIKETEYSQDSLTPICSSNVAWILRQTGSFEFEVFDAATDADLVRVVDKALNGSKVVFVGSLGLADALAEKVVITKKQLPEVSGCKKPLIICGSQYKHSYDQMQVAINRYGRTALQLYSDKGKKEAVDWPQAGPLFVYTGTEPIGEDARPPHKVLERLTSKCLDLIKEFAVDGIGIVGGETANSIFRAIGTSQLNVHGRIANVVSYGIIPEGLMKNRPFATKGGSVGADDALVRMIEYLMEGKISGLT